MIIVGKYFEWMRSLFWNDDKSSGPVVFNHASGVLGTSSRPGAEVGAVQLSWLKDFPTASATTTHPAQFLAKCIFLNKLKL